MALKYTQHGPLYIGYIFAFYATKIGSRDSGDTKVNPHWFKDPPSSFNGPCYGPTIHLIGPLWILRRQPGEAWVGLNSNNAQDHVGNDAQKNVHIFKSDASTLLKVAVDLDHM